MQSAIHSQTVAATRVRRAGSAVTLVLFLLASTVSIVPANQDQTRPRQTTTQTTTTAQPARQTQSAPPPPPSRPAPQQQQPTRTAPTQGTPELRTSPDADAQDEGTEVDPDEIINVDTSLINLQVRVVDRQGRPINNIRKEDLRVFEDGVPQQVEFFSTEEVPISYGLAIDTSRSLKDQIVQVIEASKAIVETNKPGDETVLFQFRKDTELILDFTANKQAVIEKLDELYVSAGQTAVIDAVYLAAEHVATRKARSDADPRRRALIVVTDGEERGSQYEQKQLFDFLREQGVQIYVIGFVKELEAEGSFIKKSPRKKAEELMNRIASETGGRVFLPESVAELPKIAEEITRDLRTQFVVGYIPTNKARDGRFRSVRVTVADAGGKDKRIALTRSGYTPGGDNRPSAPPQQTRPTERRRDN